MSFDSFHVHAFVSSAPGKTTRALNPPCASSTKTRGNHEEHEKCLHLLHENERQKNCRRRTVDLLELHVLPVPPSIESEQNTAIMAPDVIKYMVNGYFKSRSDLHRLGYKGFQCPNPTSILASMPSTWQCKCANASTYSVSVTAWTC